MGFDSRLRLRFAAVAACAFAATLVAAQSWANDDRDDERCAGNNGLRLVNGRIHTMDAKDRIVSSVLIRNGRFAAVGHGGDGGDDCVREIDLRGRTAVPGIIDSHNHIILLGLRPGRDTRLEFANSIPEVLATFTARAKEIKPGEWITAIGGFSRNQFFKAPQTPRFPTLAELDGAVNDPRRQHPIFMMESFSGPGATNSLGKAFFEGHGITVGSDGSMSVPACLNALFLLRQMQTRESMLQGLHDAMAFAAGVGVTTHLDQGGFPAAGDATDGAANFDRYRAHDSVRELYHQGKLTNRIWINFLHLEGDPETPELKARLLNSWNDFGNHMLRVLGIGEFTAGPDFLNPGTDAWKHGTRLVAAAGWRNENHSLNFTVPPFFLPDKPRDWQVIIDGWLEVHNEMLKAGSPDGIKNLRWVLAHVPFLGDGNDFTTYTNRLKDLGAGVNVLGGWRWLTGNAANNGPQFRKLLASGIPMGMSSDGMQISVMSPGINLYYVVTGKNARGELINAGQTLERNDAMRLYTANNGWFLEAEDKLGTIEEGKLGDVVVLSGDYFDQRAVPDEKLIDLRSVLTVVGGKVVYDDLNGRSKDYWKAGLP